MVLSFLFKYTDCLLLIQDIPVNDFLPIQVHVHICSNDPMAYSCVNRSGNVKKSSTTLFGVINLEGIKDNCKKDITFSLEYETGLQIKSTDSHILSNSCCVLNISVYSAAYYI